MIDTSELRSNDLNWNIAETKFQKILSQISMSNALQIVFQIIEIHAHYYSNIEWLKEYLKLTAEFKPIDYNKYDFIIYSHSFTEESTVSFLRGLGIIDSCYRRVVNNNSHSEDYSKLTDGICEIFGARLHRFRLENYPESFISEEDLDMDAQEALSRVDAYRNSEQRQVLIQELWNSVADTIDKFANG